MFDSFFPDTKSLSSLLLGGVPLALVALTLGLAHAPPRALAETPDAPEWVTPATKPKTDRVRYRTTVEIPSAPVPAVARIRLLSPRGYRLFLNGQGVTLGDTPLVRPRNFDASAFVRPGANTIEVEAFHDPDGDPAFNSLAFDFRAWDANGNELARQVSHAATVAADNAPTTRAVWRRYHTFPEDTWQFQRLALRGDAEPLSPLVRAALTVRLPNDTDRLPVETPVAVRVRVLTLDPPGDSARVVLRAENWAGETAFEATAAARWTGLDGEAAFDVPPLPRGVYRFDAWLDPGDDAPPLGRDSRYAALAVLAHGETRLRSIFDTLTPVPERPYLQGTDMVYRDSAAFLLSIRDLGVNFLDFHIGPNWGHFTDGTFDDFLAFTKATGIRFALNNEEANWVGGWVDETGRNHYVAPGRCHRWDLAPEHLAKAAATGLFVGVVYDEPEHMQLCRNFYANLADKENRRPYFVETTGMTLPEAYEATVAAIKRVVEHNRRHGAATIAESVLPALFHPMARAGVVLCPKLLKETIHPVTLALALGAAKQYGTPLWFSPDFWHVNEYPGHSVADYREALRLAHRAGVDTVYTEELSILAPAFGPHYKISDYGRALRTFLDEELPASTRAYTHWDYAPDVAIVRFPDTDWGQASCGYWNKLYGARNLHSTPETREWLRIWSLLTRGGTHPEAVCAVSHVYKPDEYRFTIPAPSVAVYDHLVGYEHLASASTLFLCGIEISAPTLEAVEKRVREGATCFAPPRLAPTRVRAKATTNGETSLPAQFDDGKGSWVLVSDFTPEALGPYAALLPPPPENEMELRFQKEP